MSDGLLQQIAQRQKQVIDYLHRDDIRLKFDLLHLQDAVYSYINAGGKSLRPAVLMFACGAVGGYERTALPAAAAVELYHTFTLVHDDIIDRDTMRRSVETVHTEFTRRGQSELGYDERTSTHYGLAIAILAGDMQQGWAASLLPRLHTEFGLPAELALHLTTELFTRTQVLLINGETTDIRQAETPIDDLTEQDVLGMLWQKTGILYEFAGRAGAAIGLQVTDLSHPTVEAVAQFAGKCGIAFQIQDDVLGIVGDTQKTGKSVGSDIREGKRTIIVLHALKNMSQADHDAVLAVLGNPEASEDAVKAVIQKLDAAGGIDYARDLSMQYVEDALTHLDVLSESESKDNLIAWADYITARNR